MTLLNPSTLLPCSGQAIAAQQDAAGIYASQTAIEALIEQEVARGIAPEHIFLAGFSQGGAVALHTGLRQRVPLCGLLILSAYLPLAETAQTEASSSSRETPIFMAHGRNDPSFPARWVSPQGRAYNRWDIPLPGTTTPCNTR